MAKQAKELNVTFTKERETKNKVRYQEQGDDEPQAVGALYVHKDKIAELGDPDELTVAIKAS